MAQPLGRRFWAVWLGSSISYLAEGLLFGALPLLAATLTRDPRLISITDALGQAGWLLLGLASGVAADRLPRLPLMWASNAVRALTAGVFALLVWAGLAGLPTIYALGFVLGLAAPFFDNASSSVLPELVDATQFGRANSLTQMSLALAGNLLGPMVGTVVFVLAPAAPFGFAALAFAVGTAITAWVSRRAPGRPAHTGTQSNLELLREGFSYLIHHRVLRTLAVSVGVVNFVSSGVIAVMVLYVLELLNLPQSAYGLVMAAFAVGAIAGALASVPLVRWWGERQTVLASIMGFAVASIVLGAVPQLVVSFAAFVLTGFVSMAWTVTVNSYRQRVVPSELLGRVTARLSDDGLHLHATGSTGGSGSPPTRSACRRPMWPVACCCWSPPCWPSVRWPACPDAPGPAPLPAD